MREPRGAVSFRFADADRPVVTSIIVSAELRFGLARRPSARLANQIETVLGRLTVLSFDGGVDEVYARIRAALERQGTPIGANDLFIAAHAMALGATLVTDDSDFARVEGLAVENWLRD